MRGAELVFDELTLQDSSLSSAVVVEGKVILRNAQVSGCSTRASLVRSGVLVPQHAQRLIAAGGMPHIGTRTPKAWLIQVWLLCE